MLTYNHKSQQTSFLVQNQPKLASALQTAFNLHVLPSLVLTLLTDLTESVEARVKIAFDISSLSKDAAAKGMLFTNVSLLRANRYCRSQCIWRRSYISFASANRAHKHHSGAMGNRTMGSNGGHGGRYDCLLHQGTLPLSF